MPNAFGRVLCEATSPAVMFIQARIAFGSFSSVLNMVVGCCVAPSGPGTVVAASAVLFAPFARRMVAVT